MELEGTVEVPQNTGKITLKKQGKVTYVEYTYAREYKEKKKYNIPKRKTIGKLCADDPSRMHPNQNFAVFFPDVELPEDDRGPVRSNCLKIGSYAVIRKIIEDYGLNEIMSQIIGKGSGLFLDIAAYTIITENNAAQYYPDYAFNHPLMTEGMKVYSDSVVGEFMKNISIDQRIRFLNQWNAKRDHREKIYISYDSTNKAVEAGDIDEAEPGHAKDEKSYPIINYSIAYDRTNRVPLFYEDYPGSVIDITQLQCMLEKAKSLGYSRCGFILDRGYFSKSNIRYMDKNGYDFIMMVKGQKKRVHALINEYRGKFEDVRQNSIRQFRVYGTTIPHKLYADDEKDRYFHLYYSSYRHAEEQEDIEDRIEKEKKLLKKAFGKTKEMDSCYDHYFTPIYYHEGQEDQTLQEVQEKSGVIEEEIRYCGYFCIITSKKMSAKDALTIYKSRDESEKLFREDKTFLDNATLGVQKQNVADAKIFIEFVALVIRNKIYTSLVDEAKNEDIKANYMNVPAALKELEKIEMTRMGNGEYALDHAVTKTQKKILKAFGMDAVSIQKEAARIGKVLEDKDGKNEEAGIAG